ncbi:hypothetical protein NCLIV_039850 [Neospora caninum Liverpool]|uniref:At4g15545-like C-terminal domain-containing protein n=1 Tax=Neospora caninum (strain Liverpool) TaxID=572307 RepID=F0VBC6_NEOCL|nr:hypothetical protein NCLIV_039850 [Neospora caninum Liverpool]CBZ50910.1 hypothetical protein NCLIV_039850 [Neospora caninum Liverpool]|eukprot:XP_003880943.1 hypothetical protein NCLIV_039850 [Neospora caninum Liverpool]
MTSTTASTAGTDLSWLPSDAEEQLALGFRIVSNAYKTRYGVLQKKHSSLEVQLIESTQRGNQLAEENKQLVATIKKLHRDILRLESLKKAVLNSIQEDHSDADESSHKYYAPEDMLQTAAPRTMSEINGVDDMGTAFLSKLNSAEGPFLAAPNPSTGTVNARSRMSYENFNLFLANIKKLNSHQQDREETLRNAQRLFGEGNRDLFEEFKVMINRHP